jgi:hypothetical protein
MGLPEGGVVMFAANQHIMAAAFDFTGKVAVPYAAVRFDQPGTGRLIRTERERDRRLRFLVPTKAIDAGLILARVGRFRANDPDVSAAGIAVPVTMVREWPGAFFGVLAELCRHRDKPSSPAATVSGLAVRYGLAALPDQRSVRMRQIPGGMIAMHDAADPTMLVVTRSDTTGDDGLPRWVDAALVAANEHPSRVTLGMEMIDRAVAPFTTEPGVPPLPAPRELTEAELDEWVSAAEQELRHRS